MIKLTGLIMIIVFCSLSGMSMSIKLCHRVNIIDKCVSFLGALTDELKYTLAPVEDLLCSLNDREEFAGLDFLGIALGLCQSGTPFPLAFKGAINSSKLDFENEERKIICSLSEILGAMDIDGQINAITHCKYLLEEKLKVAKTKKESHSGIYKTLGVLSGFALAIILI